MTHLTPAEAVALAESEFWKLMDFRARAEFQLHQECLCMPFDVFHEAVEKALGRPVWTHEFAAPDRLKAELRGDSPPPTMQQILDLIPAEKRIVLVSR
jgi:hypothetical protein